MDDARPYPPLRWRKSSYSSGGEGNCVEVAVLPHKVAVRDSKKPDGSLLVVSAAQWAAFLGSVVPPEASSV